MPTGSIVSLLQDNRLEMEEKFLAWDNSYAK